MTAGRTTRILVIACGAIARELVRIKDMNNWNHLEIQCLPADLHNTPERIPGAVKEKIESRANSCDKTFVAYADCGTGGLLDRMLAEHGIERIPGDHCYEFLAGSEVFNGLAKPEIGSFFLTDFLVRHFDRLVIEGLGLDRYPQLMDSYFGNYKRVVYLAQTDTAKLRAAAQKQAEYLGLEYHYRFCGDLPLTRVLKPALQQEQADSL